MTNLMKSNKDIVRDILKAQGIRDPEPTPEAVKILSRALFEKWQEGNTDGWHDATYD